MAALYIERSREEFMNLERWTIGEEIKPRETKNELRFKCILNTKVWLYRSTFASLEYLASHMLWATFDWHSAIVICEVYCQCCYITSSEALAAHLPGYIVWLAGLEILLKFSVLVAGFLIVVPLFVAPFVIPIGHPEATIPSASAIGVPEARALLFHPFAYKAEVRVARSCGRRRCRF